MTTRDKIYALAGLRNVLLNSDLSEVISNATAKNPWFTSENISHAIQSVIKDYLDQSALEKWVAGYPLESPTISMKIGLVLAGNIPLVGFHDLLCVFMANHVAQVKLSEKDDILIPFLIESLGLINPDTREYFEIVPKLSGYDKVIATGSNNTATYFSYYFKNVPHVIRKNRNSVAVLTGKESKEDLALLCKDIFLYFGLGCRNVSKVFLPMNYDFNMLFHAFDEWSWVAHHNKYKNNLDYNHALYLLNRQKFLMHETAILVESEIIPSRVACLHYSYYDDLDQVKQEIISKENEIQCVVGKEGLFPGMEIIPYGYAQSPTLDSYADGVDTMKFLL